VGLIGIKVWICNGEVYGKRDLSPNIGAKNAKGGKAPAGASGKRAETRKIAATGNKSISIIKRCYNRRRPNSGGARRA